MEDETTARSVLNGYFLHDIASGGTAQNTYFTIAMPERTYDELFDVPVHKLVIRYKDVAPGVFQIKERSKNRGDILEFEPIKDGEIICVGDGEWKEKVILMEPSCFGWYMGYEYHKYHGEELMRIAEITDNYYLKQYAQKWMYYLEVWQRKGHVIVDIGRNEVEEIDSDISIIKDIESEDDFGLENSLDGNWSDNYTISSKEGLPQEFILELSEEQKVDFIVFMWESADNNAKNYQLEGIDGNGNIVWTVKKEDQLGMEQIVEIGDNGNIKAVKVTVTETNGESKILIRQIRFLKGK